MELTLTSWGAFSDICIVKKSLPIQYVEFGDRVKVIGPDANGINWSVTLQKQNPDGSDNPEYVTFMSDFAPNANEKITPTAIDGTPQVNSVPSVDSKMACFCPPVSSDPTPQNPNVDYPVTDTFVQLFGMELEIQGAVKGDAIRFQVGYNGPSGWVTVSDYGGKKFVGSSFIFGFSSPRVSNPIPQGLILRLAYQFVNQDQPSTPSVSVMYHLQRPYAQ